MYNNEYLNVSYLLSLLMSIGNVDDTTYSHFMMFDEKLMGYSVSLVIEIDDLLYNGRTKNEIIDIINDCDFQANNPELTIEEALYLKHEALRLLDIRYELYNENKDKNNKKHLLKL